MNEPGLNDQAMPGDTGKEQPVLVSPGARLAAGRQERGWTVEQVASQLNLAPRQVIALEADDYPSLPGMATVRGFVRQYAKLLKIDAAPLLASLSGETMLAQQEPIRPRQNLSTPFSEARLPSMNARSGSSAKWLVAGVVIVAIGAVAYALQQGVDFAGMSQSATSQVKDGLSQMTSPAAPAASQGAGAAPAPDAVATTPEPVNAQPPMEPAAGGDTGNSSQSPAQPVNPAAPAMQQGSAAASQSSTPAATPGVTSAGVPATPAPAASPSAAAPSAPASPAAPAAAAGTSGAAGAPANPANALVISARQDSWVEVRPAGGKPLIARVVKAGETQSFEVTDTFAVVIGNASGVDATLRGAPVELKAPGNGNVARLTLK